MSRTEVSAGNSFALSRPAVNITVALMVLIAGAIYCSFYLVGHIAENTVFTLSNVHDLSDAMLAPILTSMIMLLFTHKTLGRFLGYTYLVLLSLGIAASCANAMIFDRFDFTQYEILPRVLVTVPMEIVLFTVLTALFISGEAIVRELRGRTRRRTAARLTA
ncbi:hypothetical protein [Brevibacterium oceani]|uniref:hypothetical protein n=1 Tax=Brevibacterium oceani TaxID=358099 RepID=UPI001B33838B|nr:hypothetical protein [Brevibacterium oceani]